MAGLFITLEGGEGSGKTTVSEMIATQLRKEGYQVVLTREPGGVDIAEQIRNVIVNVNNKAMDAKTEALLYAASRRQHLVERVVPVLNNNGIVICDRFIDSSLVYQGIARHIGIEKVYQMNLFATEELMPSLTIFFDVAPEIGLKRLNDNNREKNRLDLESLQFHQDVYEGYKTIQAMFPDRIKSIDASADVNSVYQQALDLIRMYL